MKIAGVPEHFNLPWRILAHEQPNVVEWIEYAAGSGAMVQALQNFEIDAAMILTEAAVVALSNGVPIDIIGTYVKSPLPWGIHLPPSAKLHDVLQKPVITFAISRYGSGSHIMAYVMAEKFGLPKEKLKFSVVENLEGALKSHAEGLTDIFLWEKVITSPHVAAGKLSYHGAITAWWPAFLLVTLKSRSQDEKVFLKQLLQKSLVKAVQLKQLPDFEKQVSEQYGLSLEMAKEWSKYVEWSAYGAIQADLLLKLHDFLNKCGLNLSPIYQIENHILQ